MSQRAQWRLLFSVLQLLYGSCQHVCAAARPTGVCVFFFFLWFYTNNTTSCLLGVCAFINNTCHFEITIIASEDSECDTKTNLCAVFDPAAVQQHSRLAPCNICLASSLCNTGVGQVAI